MVGKEILIEHNAFVPSPTRVDSVNHFACGRAEQIISAKIAWKHIQWFDCQQAV
jgi:hypothetical protein